MNNLIYFVKIERHILNSYPYELGSRRGTKRRCDSTVTYDLISRHFFSWCNVRGDIHETLPDIHARVTYPSKQGLDLKGTKKLHLYDILSRYESGYRVQTYRREDIGLKLCRRFGCCCYCFCGCCYYYYCCRCRCRFRQDNTRRQNELWS